MPNLSNLLLITVISIAPTKSFASCDFNSIPLVETIIEKTERPINNYYIPIDEDVCFGPNCLEYSNMKPSVGSKSGRYIDEGYYVGMKLKNIINDAGSRYGIGQRIMKTQKGRNWNRLATSASRVEHGYELQETGGIASIETVKTEIHKDGGSFRHYFYYTWRESGPSGRSEQELPIERKGIVTYRCDDFTGEPYPVRFSFDARTKNGNLRHRVDFE